MSGTCRWTYIRFLPSKYFSKKIETSQILIGKGPLVFKTYRELKTILIFLKNHIVTKNDERPQREFDFQIKKPSRNVFQDSREKNKNECVSTNVARKLTSLLLHWNVHTCAPITNSYFL